MGTQLSPSLSPQKIPNSLAKHSAQPKVCRVCGAMCTEYSMALCNAMCTVHSVNVFNACSAMRVQNAQRNAQSAWCAVDGA